MTIRSSQLYVLAAALLPLAAVGCGASGGVDAYKPSTKQARTALETALSAWRDGKTIDQIEAKPSVRAVDSGWRNGDQIDSFEILDEQETSDGVKQFKVKLGLKSPKEPIETNFMVHGLDPVYVFREEDYKRTIDMDNNPIAADSAGR